MQSSHVADQAGGEIFESTPEDVPPLTFPEETTSEEIEPATIMSPEQAFEVFAGKLFAVDNPYKNNKNKHSTETLLSPVERLSKLKLELDALTQLYKTTDTINDDNTNTHTSTDNNNVEILSNLQAQLSQLSNLQASQSQAIDQTLKSSVEGLQQEAPQTRNNDTTTTTTTASLEARLQVLEQRAASLSKIDQLEAQFQTLNLEQHQKTAKLIRHDLEAAAKARHKLGNTNTSSSSATDNQAIASLYNELQALQGLSQHLPKLALHLQRVAQTKVGGRGVEMITLQQSVQGLSRTLESVEQSMQALQTNLQQTTTTLLNNVQQLEAKMGL